MPDVKLYDDPLWEWVLGTKVQEYIPVARDFWERIHDIDISGTGCYPVKKGIHTDRDVPPGFQYRVTNTPVRSPIKNIQVFPFIPVGYLQIANVAGGVSKMISRVCSDNRFTIEEFTIIEKHNLPSTYNQGQFIAIVPTAMLENAKILGRWVYLNLNEMTALCLDNILPSVKTKLIKYIK